MVSEQFCPQLGVTIKPAFNEEQGIRLAEPVDVEQCWCN